MSYNVGEEVEVISTGVISTIESVSKNIWRQKRYKIIGNSTKYKERELRRVSHSTVNTISNVIEPDLTTQVVISSVYMDQSNIVPNKNEPTVITDPVSEKSESNWVSPVSTETKPVDSSTSSWRSSSSDNSSSSSRWSSSSDDSSSYDSGSSSSSSSD